MMESQNTSPMLETLHTQLQQLITPDQDRTILDQTLAALTRQCQRQAQVLETMTIISETMTSSAETEDSLVAVVRLIQAQLGLQYAGLFTPDDADHPPTIKVQAGTPAYQLDSTNGPIKQVLDTHTTAFTAHASYRELILPCLNQADLVGVLVLHGPADTSTPLAETDIPLLDSLVKQLVHLLQHFKLSLLTDRQLEQVVMLQNVNLQVSAQGDLETVLTDLAQVGTLLMNADACVIRLAEDEMLTVGAFHNPMRKMGLQLENIAVGRGISGQVAATKQPILANNWLKHPLAAEEPSYRRTYDDAPLAMLCVPILSKDRLIGTIEVQSYTKAYAYDENDQSILALLAAQSANIIDNIHLLNQEEHSRRFLKTILDHIPDPVFIKDRNFTLVATNRANGVVIGQPTEALLGKTDYDLFSPDRANELRRRDIKLLRNNEPLEFKDYIVWHDGAEHIVYTRLIPIADESGQPEYLLGISNDITERERLLAETSTLYEGIRDISSALSARQVFEALFEQLRTYNPIELAAYRFSLVREEPVWAELRNSWHRDGTPTYPPGARLYANDTPLMNLMMNATAIFIDDVAADERLTSAEREIFAGVASVAILPLSATWYDFGAIVVYFDAPFTFDSHIQRLWNALSDQTSIALLNRQLIEGAAYRAVQMDTAAEVARAASSILDQAALLKAAVDLVQDRFQLYYVGAFLVDADKEWAVLKAGTGEAGQKQLKRGHRLKIGGESMIGWSVHHRKPRIALDVGKDAVHFQNPDLPDTRSEMALPLLYGTQVIGALTVQSAEQAAFSREDIVFFQTMADQLAIAIQNAELYQTAQQELVERHRITNELRFSEANYRELVQAANSIIFRMDTAGNITFVNEFGQSFFGYTAEELIGQPALGTIVPETDSHGQRQGDYLIADIVENPEYYAYNQNENLKKNGERVWISWSNTALYNDEGDFTEILCVGNDITAYRKAEEERRMLALAVNQSPGIVIITDAKGNIEYTNPRFTAITGYTFEEVQGQNPRLLQSGYFEPEDYEALWQKITTGQTWQGEFHNRKKNGDFYWAASTISPIRTPEGDITHFLAVQEDITVRKQTEEILRKERQLLRTLIDALPSLVYVKDQDGKYMLNNKAHIALLGAESQEEVVGRNDFDYFPEHLAQQYRADEQVMVQLDQSIEGQEEIIVDSTGQTRWVLTNKVTLKESNDEIIGLIGVSYDITERKAAETALQNSLKRTQLLYNISEALSTMTHQQAALETVLGEFILLMGLNRGGIMLHDHSSDMNVVQALYIDGRIKRDTHLAFPAKEDKVYQYMVENPFPLIVEDAKTHPLTQDTQHIRGEEVEAMLFIPLMVRGDVVGLIGADALEKGYQFPREDIEVAKLIADQLSIWQSNSLLLSQAESRSTLLQAAAEVSRAASSILDTQELIETSVNLIRDHFDFYYVGLFLVDNANEWAVLIAGTGEAGQNQLARGHRLKVGEESMIGWSVVHGKPRIALDVGKDAIRFQNPDLPDTHSEMALPLRSRDAIIGALTVQSTEHGAFSDDDVTSLQTMADQLANAIANAELFENVTQARQEAEYRLRENKALQKLGQELVGTLHMQEILDIFFRACTIEVGFEYVTLWLVDYYQGHVRLVDAVGISDLLRQVPPRSLSSSTDITVDIVKTGATEVITGWDDRFDKALYDSDGHANWLRVFTPITLRQENIGLVEAGYNQSKNVKTINKRQLRLLKAFIAQTALAIDNAQRYEATQRIARREALIKDITTKVRASTDLNTILQTTVREIGTALHGQRAYVQLVSPTNGDSVGENKDE